MTVLGSAAASSFLPASILDYLAADGTVPHRQDVYFYEETSRIITVAERGPRQKLV